MCMCMNSIYLYVYELYVSTVRLCMCMNRMYVYVIELNVCVSV